MGRFTALEQQPLECL